MSFELEFSAEFLIDIKKHQKAGNKILLKKIDSFLSEIRETPTDGTGKPEQLKYFKAAIWSRRISDKHRLVYELKDNVVEILSGFGHYDDK
ncbi:Txe/YoeB family addiction module toxin [Halpernia sp.]|uniref:Txe/YoeB family addiction module toxin n=1 Tax=Halpernia sp. TaxID=2782209 RepID=UPI003A90E8B6